MIHLGVSVGIANILLWIFAEVFIVIMTFNATRLYASKINQGRLATGEKIPVPSTLSLIDRLPYNGDLLIVKEPTKLVLTILRVVAVIVSVYLGSILDGEVRHVGHRFEVTSVIDIAKLNMRKLSENSGNDISAMAKMSCLRIHNNNDVVLYKGYIGSKQDIVCEDGLATYTTQILVAAQIRAGESTPESGISMDGMSILKGLDSNKNVNSSSFSVIYRKQSHSGNDIDEQIRIVLNRKMKDNMCEFGLQRSAGGGFQSVVDLKVNTTCSITIVDFDRLIQPKPPWMPPRMSFLYHFLDSVVVCADGITAPAQRGTTVDASVTVSGLCIGVFVAVVSTIVSTLLWATMRGKQKVDLTSPEGVANLWHCEKFRLKLEESSFDNMYIALDQQKKCPYLGSLDMKFEPPSPMSEGTFLDGITISTSDDRSSDLTSGRLKS